jgi:hypothetical protein
LVDFRRAFPREARTPAPRARDEGSAASVVSLCLPLSREAR